MKFIAVLVLAVGLACAHEVPSKEIHQYYCMQWIPVQEPYHRTTQEHYDISEKITNQTTLIDVIQDTLDRQTDLMVKVLAEISKGSDNRIDNIDEKLSNQTNLLDKQSYLLDEILEEIGNLPNSTRDSDKKEKESKNDLKLENKRLLAELQDKTETQQKLEEENQSIKNEISRLNESMTAKPLLDMILLVDQTTSNDPYEEKVKRFLTDLLSQYDIGRNGIRVALVTTYRPWSHPTLNWNLNSHETSNVGTLLTSINRTAYAHDGAELSATNTYQYLIGSVINGPGDRPNVPNVVITLSDFNTGLSGIVSEINNVKAHARMMAVHFGSKYPSTMARAVTSTSTDVMKLDNVSGAKARLDQLVTMRCTAK